MARRHQRRVHDRAIHHGVLRQRLQAEADQFVALLGLLFSSTALIELDPMSSPTTGFCFAIAKHRSPFCAVPGAAAPSAASAASSPCDWRIFRSIQRSSTDLRNFQRLPSLKAGTMPVADVAIQSVGRDSQILRSLAQVHDFSRLAHARRLPRLREAPGSPRRSLAGTPHHLPASAHCCAQGSSLPMGECGIRRRRVSRKAGSGSCPKNTG